MIDDKTEDLAVLQRWVVVITGAAASPDTLIFAEPIVIGSDAACDIVIDHATVLPRHLRLVPNEECVVVEEAGGQIGSSTTDETKLLVGQECFVGVATLSIKRSS